MCNRFSDPSSFKEVSLVEMVRTFLVTTAGDLIRDF